MFRADPRPRALRRSSRTSLAIVVTALALGGCAVGGWKPGISGDAPARSARVPCDGPEHDLGIRWEPSLDAAFQRGRRERKPVVIAFSARRQDSDFAGEF